MKSPIYNNHLPAGLLDDNCEFFTQGSNVYALYKGKVIPFEEFPQELLDLLNIDLSKYPDAINALIDLNLLDEKSMLWQYTRCRFGGFDGEPDIYNGQLKHTEYFECGERGTCKYEGKLCQAIKVKNGYLTKREIQILKCIAEGLLDKEIADALNISINTVPVFKKNIQDKTGLTRKADMTRFAIQKNIISNDPI